MKHRVKYNWLWFATCAWLCLAVGPFIACDDDGDGGGDAGPTPDAVDEVADEPVEDVADEPEPVVCGGETCDPALALQGTPLCCTADYAGNYEDPLGFTGQGPDRCGTDIGDFVPEAAGLCLELNGPGDPDENCPDIDDGMGGAYEGCCMETGFCGGLETFIGGGCYFFDFENPQTCGE